MNFTAIDFETANGKRSSACALGIAVVKSCEIVETRYWLMRPQPFQFNYFNVLVNGLTEKQLANKPSFCDYWDEIKPYIENQVIIAHNAAFDVSVLLSVLRYYEIHPPSLKYICTYQAGRKFFQHLLNYKLDTLAAHIGIQFRHHNAAEDAETAAKIMSHMIRSQNHAGVEYLAQALDLQIGEISASHHLPCKFLSAPPPRSTPNRALPISKTVTASRTEFDTTHPFYDRTVVFTGFLNGLSRMQAAQIVADLGGHPADTVTKKTDYLVVGIQDDRLLRGHPISSKTRKAIQYAKLGTGIQIISEDDFYNMIGGEIHAS